MAHYDGITKTVAYAGDGYPVGLEVANIAGNRRGSGDTALKFREVRGVADEHGNPVAASGKSPGGFGTDPALGPDPGDKADGFVHDPASDREGAVLSQANPGSPPEIPLNNNWPTAVGEESGEMDNERDHGNVGQERPARVALHV